MKIITFAACALVASAAFAQEQEKRSIKENATDPVVQEVLSQPEGVGIVRNESDGSLQIFARGTAAYDFGDARDIRSKTKVAELRAKAALSKFISEVVKVEESATGGEGRLLKTVLTQTNESEVMKRTVTRDVIEGVKETLTVSSAAILSGVVVLKTVKIPTEGSKTSGEIQVTLGISTKTLAAATEAHNMITDSLNARGEVGEGVGQRHVKEPIRREGTANGASKPNKPEVRTNNTIF